MDRAYKSGASGTPPTAPVSPSAGYPISGDPQTAIPATKPGPYWYHMIMEELLAIISAAAIAPAIGTLTQVRDALYVLFARLGAANTFTKAQRGAYVALTSTAGSIAVDLSLANNFNHAMTENTTLAAPTNAVAGQAGVIEIAQHASAVKTLAYNTFWQFENGSVPAIGTVLSGNQKLFYVVDQAGTSATCALMDQRS